MNFEKKRKYILFGPAYGIGGWQLYINARCKHLSEKEIELYLIYSPDTGGNTIKLSYIEKTKKLQLEQVEPYWYSHLYVEKKIKEILEFINYNKNDEIFIESTCIIYSFWGEILAKATNGQNFCYLLHSHTKGFPRAWQRFFSFKYDQKLIAGQTEITLPDLFDGFREIPVEESRPIFARWEAPICEFREDCNNYIQYIKTYKERGYKIIGYFGVLRKPHFSLLCDFMVNYSNQHKDSAFLFIAIGSSGESKPEKKLYEVQKSSNNLKTYNIPEMYPIPKIIFELLDICLASWGSSLQASRICKRTIRLFDDVNLIPHGVMGVTIQEPYHLQSPTNETMDNIFDEILFGNNYKDKTYIEPKEIDMFSEGHEKIDLDMKPFFIRENGKKYYDIFSIPFTGGISMIKYVLFHLLGVNNTRRCADIIRKILKCKILEMAL